MTWIYYTYVYNNTYIYIYIYIFVRIHVYIYIYWATFVWPPQHHPFLAWGQINLANAQTPHKDTCVNANGVCENVLVFLSLFLSVSCAYILYIYMHTRFYQRVCTYVLASLNSSPSLRRSLACSKLSVDHRYRRCSEFFLTTINCTSLASVHPYRMALKHWLMHIMPLPQNSEHTSLRHLITYLLT